MKNKNRREAREAASQDEVRAASSGLLSSSSRARVSLVLVLGGSAGSVKALQEFLSQFPFSRSTAAIIALHLDPEHPCELDKVFAQMTDYTVSWATQDSWLRGGEIYLVPPHSTIGFLDGKLQLYVSERKSPPHTIDDCFTAVAEQFDCASAGIIFSGSGSDGVKGIRAIRGHGGITLAQSPDDAEFPAMPQAVVQAGLVVESCPARELGPLLFERIHLVQSGEHSVHASSDIDFGETLPKIISCLRKKVNFDFREYKTSTLSRRILRRMYINGYSEPDEYYCFLRNNIEEAEILARDILINLTSFFRDTEAFQSLEEAVIPDLLKRIEVDQSVRVWVAGCSSGEEAYSVAMLFLELMDGKSNAALQIFATDVNEDALSVARNGIYSDSIEKNVSRERLERFFHKSDGFYQVRKELREVVVFANQNVLYDPPFSRLDLISCRNLFIYFDSAAQRKIINTFHFALRNHGYLMLGNSETMSRAKDLFRQLSKRSHIFQRLDTGKAGPLELSKQQAPQHHQALSTLSTTNRKQSIAQLLRLTEQAILRDAIGGAVLVNRDYEMLFLHGKVERYLEIREGRPSQNLLDHCTEEVRSRVRAAVFKASREQAPVIASHIPIDRGGRDLSVELSVLPTLRSPEGQELFVLLFRDEPNTPTEFRTEDSEEIVARRQLELELRVTREDLQNTIEELERSNETMRASHEEMMSINEELQSSNEELETSKEELQSLNEELNTVNSELQSKVEELESTTNDLANFLHSADVATLFLDSSFQIRRYTPAIHQLMNLIPSDIGRPIRDISTSFDNALLKAKCAEVLESLIPQQLELSTEDRGWYLLRVLPYRTSDDRIEGVVATFTNITERKKREDAIAANERHFRLLCDAAPVLIWASGPDQKCEFFNRQWLEYTGKPLEKEIGEGWTKGVHPDDLDHYQKASESAFQRRETFEREYRLRRYDGEYHWMLDRGVPRYSESGEFLGYIGSCTEITELREKADLELQLRQAQKMEALGVLAGGIAHDFNNILSAVLGHAELAKFEILEGTDVTPRIDAVMDASNRARDLVSQILTFSRREEVAASSVVLHESFQNVLVLVRASLPSAITIETFLPDVGKVCIDATQLHQLLLNLCANAAQSMGEGGTLTLSLSKILVDESITTKVPELVVGNEYAKIVVADTGDGIPPEHLPHLFEPFFTTKKPGEGTGMGLAVVYGIVQRSGGAIQVDSKVGQGSTFTIYLPSTDETESSKHTEPENVPHGSGHILFVDDQPGLSQLAKELLQSVGYEVTAVSSPEEALRLFRETPSSFDLLVTDQNMPGMRGSALARIVKEIRQDLPILISTGFTNESPKVLGIGLYVDGLVKKPYLLKELAIAVWRALVKVKKN